jgi:hypothetical protein
MSVSPLLVLTLTLLSKETSALQADPEQVRKFFKHKNVAYQIA